MTLCALTTIFSSKKQKALAPCVNFAPFYLSPTGLTVVPAQPGTWSPISTSLPSVFPFDMPGISQLPDTSLQVSSLFLYQVDKDSRETSTIVSFYPWLSIPTEYHSRILELIIYAALLNIFLQI